MSFCHAQPELLCRKNPEKNIVVPVPAKNLLKKSGKKYCSASSRQKQY
jgi:hypothetical protein